MTTYKSPSEQLPSEEPVSDNCHLENVEIEEEIDFFLDFAHSEIPSMNEMSGVYVNCEYFPVMELGEIEDYDDMTEESGDECIFN